MAIKPNNDKQLKQIAEAILKAKGQTYADWLREQHYQLLIENSSILAKAISEKGENE